MSNKKQTERQKVKEWMKQDNFKTDEVTLSKIFQTVKYFQREKNLDLRKAYLVAYMKHINDIYD